MVQTDPRLLYIELMKKCLTGLIYEDPGCGPYGQPFSRFHREVGHDWPLKAHTMIGEKRMNNLRDAVIHVLRENIPGDLIETGVWRGGACIFMRAILAALNVTDRTVWVADSFEGLPPINAEQYPEDAKYDDLSKYAELAISLEEVQANFQKYDLLDDQVKFLKGWFKDTLPTAPIEKLALLRLDGDMYESTMDGLTNLYHKVSPGGVIIVDDYNIIPACKQAVHDFRDAHGITEHIQPIDYCAVFWIKAGAAPG